jgi:hypothetical protein
MGTSVYHSPSGLKNIVLLESESSSAPVLPGRAGGVRYQFERSMSGLD